MAGVEGNAVEGSGGVPRTAAPISRICAMVTLLPLIPPTLGHSPGYSTAWATVAAMSWVVVRVRMASVWPSMMMARRLWKSIKVSRGVTCLEVLCGEAK